MTIGEIGSGIAVLISVVAVAVSVGYKSRKVDEIDEYKINEAARCKKCNETLMTKADDNHKFVLAEINHVKEQVNEFKQTVQSNFNDVKDLLRREP